MLSLIVGYIFPPKKVFLPLFSGQKMGYLTHHQPATHQPEQAERLRLEQLQLLREAALTRRQEAQEKRQRYGAEALKKQLAAVEAQHAAEQAIKDAQLAQHKAKAEEVKIGNKKLGWGVGARGAHDVWKVFVFFLICELCVCDFVGDSGMFLDAICQNHGKQRTKSPLFRPRRWKKWPNAWCFAKWA